MKEREKPLFQDHRDLKSVQQVFTKQIKILRVLWLEKRLKSFKSLHHECFYQSKNSFTA